MILLSKRVYWLCLEKGNLGSFLRGLIFIKFSLCLFLFDSDQQGLLPHKPEEPTALRLRCRPASAVWVAPQVKRITRSASAQPCRCLETCHSSPVGHLSLKLVLVPLQVVAPPLAIAKWIFTLLSFLKFQEWQGMCMVFLVSVESYTIQYSFPIFNNSYLFSTVSIFLEMHRPRLPMNAPPLCPTRSCKHKWRRTSPRALSC